MRLCFAPALWPVSGCGLCRAGCEETQHQAPVGTSVPRCVHLPSSPGLMSGEPSLYIRTGAALQFTLYNSSSPWAFASLHVVRTECICLSSLGTRASAFGVPGSAILVPHSRFTQPRQTECNTPHLHMGLL